jgi:hypothetical protein
MTSTTNRIQCPACNSTRIALGKVRISVHECRKCGAVFGDCYKGDSYTIVLPYFHTDPASVAPEAARYYDLTVLGSAGIERRHGWFDPDTKRILQVG